MNGNVDDAVNELSLAITKAGGYVHADIVDYVESINKKSMDTT